MDPIRLVSLPDGRQMPALGQGTWEMGERPAWRGEEKSALARGIDLGMVLLDTAEMYGDGESERLVGEVIAGRRDRVFLVSKVLPGNASLEGAQRACERSLRRLGTDHLDLYLLHWSGPHPLQETVAAFERLVAQGKILGWGVSNLDLTRMQRLSTLMAGERCAINQLLYNLGRRGIEFDLLPWMAARRMPLMAYSPIERGELADHPALRDVARRLGVTAAQVALAWTLRRRDVVAIPKASSIGHVEENRRAAELQFDDGDLQRLDAAFAPPRRARPLEML